jgi:hypothetical protein
LDSAVYDRCSIDARLVDVGLVGMMLEETHGDLT